MTADPQIPLPQGPPSPPQAAPRSVDGNGSPVPAAEPSGSGPRAKPIPRDELWLRRLSVLMFVSLCAVMGVLLVILPWSLQWTDNHLLWGYPGLRNFLSNAFVRGLCSGLGILDLWIGFREASHYQEGPAVAK